MLADEGRLSIDDPIAKHLPEFRGLALVEKRVGEVVTLGTPPQPVTVKHLLTHTSGLACDLPPGFADLPVLHNRSLTELVIAYAQRPLERAPGTTWRYCGAGYDILGRIVEVAGKKPLAQFLRARLFRPLGMKDTTFQPTRAQRKRIAALYEKDTESKDSVVTRAAKQPAIPAVSRFVSAGGGLYATAADFARFMQMLLDGGSARGRRLVRPETVAQMITVHYASDHERVGFSPGLGMGLGPQIVRTPQGATEALLPGSFGHGGSTGVQVWADPKNDMVYVLMLQRQPRGDGDASEIRRAFVRLGAAAIVRVPTTPKPGLFTATARRSLP
jgi:CubicO group peptidase (beta-lactamase class C family)